MAVGDFDNYYADNPWERIDKNTRMWYDPDLVSMFRQRAIFSPVVSFRQNLGAVNATSMTITGLFDPHPDYTALSVRQIWMPASHLDSRSQTITFSRYGGKVAYYNYDDMVTYWKQNGVSGLRQIMRGALGQHMVDVLDLLARNAFLQGADTTGYTLIEGGGTSFADIGPDDLFDIDTSMDIWLGMANRGVANALGANGAAGSVICYTTPGVIYDIQNDADWVSLRQYQDLSSILRYEVGSYKGVRFVQSPKLQLFNCGTIIARSPITAAITAGDGAQDPASASKVDGVFSVGQDGVTHYIQLSDQAWDAGSIADLAVGDIITIHASVTNAHGIANGVNPYDGKLHNRRIVAIDAENFRISLDQPIMIDFTTDLGGGVYGYLTKGTHVHASIFIGGPQGVVAGVARPPRFHTPPPVDDFEMVQRFSWDAYMGYQPYAPEVFEVVYSAGTVRVKGAKVNQ